VRGPPSRLSPVKMVADGWNAIGLPACLPACLFACLFACWPVYWMPGHPVSCQARRQFWPPASGPILWYGKLCPPWLDC